MLKSRTKQVIKSQDWDKFVSKIYKRPYCLESQYEFMVDNLIEFKVPSRTHDFMNVTVEENEDTKETGVNFKSWIARDPNDLIEDRSRPFITALWWYKAFYPDIEVLANDLFKKGLLERGEYLIIPSKS